MDSGNNFLKTFREYIGSLNDDYIIGLTNKGILNRALKDLGNGDEIKISVEESGVRCELPDGNICNITEDIKKFKCTCPSRIICKHAVMSYLYIKQNFDSIFGESSDLCKEDGSDNSSGDQDFSALLLISLESIKKALGDREFGNIGKRLEFGLNAKIEEGTLLQVSFKDEGTWIKFITSKGENTADIISIKDSTAVKNCICSCKSKELCKHKAEAVIHYGIHKGVFSKEQIISVVKEERILNKEAFMDAIKEIKKIIAEIYITGLSRVSENFENEIEQAAVICHNCNLPDIEKSLRALQKELMLYINKNASFSFRSFRKLVQNIYNRATAIENCDDNEKLRVFAGEHKTTYFDIPPIKLKGVGARGWSSKSGYEGITLYFINTGFDNWFTYTSSRPTYYDDLKKVKLYDTAAPWGITGKLSELSRSEIKLVAGKVNEEFRLSSSEESKAEVLRRTDVADINLKGRMFKDWTLLFSRLVESHLQPYVSREENSNLFLLKVTTYGKSSFDSIHQEFSMPIYDESSHELNIRLKYNSSNKVLIENLERAERFNRFPHMLLSEVYIGEEEMIAIPISAYYENGTLENWTLE